MRALAIVHQRDAGPGVFLDAFRAKGIALDYWMPAEGLPPPSAPSRYAAVLTLGGAMHADQEDRHPWLRDEKTLLGALLEHGVPVLAVCLGAQLLAEAAGVPPRRARRPEIGWFDVEVDDQAADDPLLGPLAPRFEAFQWHSYEFPLPDGAVPLAQSDVCLQAYRIGERTWGIQFHAEVSRADAQAWIEDLENDEDAVRAGVDGDLLWRQTLREIDRWNELGAALCERFLVAATPA